MVLRERSRSNVWTVLDTDRQINASQIHLPSFHSTLTKPIQLPPHLCNCSDIVLPVPVQLQDGLIMVVSRSSVEIEHEGWLEIVDASERKSPQRHEARSGSGSGSEWWGNRGVRDSGVENLTSSLYESDITFILVTDYPTEVIMEEHYWSSSDSLRILECDMKWRNSSLHCLRFIPRIMSPVQVT